MPIEVADVDAEGMPELATAEISSRSGHSLRTLPTQRSAWAFAFGAWIGVRTISTSSPRKMVSKARLNFLSRS